MKYIEAKYIEDKDAPHAIFLINSKFLNSVSKGEHMKHEQKIFTSDTTPATRQFNETDDQPQRRGTFDNNIHVTPKQFYEILSRSAEVGFDSWMTSQFGISVDQSYRIVVAYTHPSSTVATPLIGEPSVAVDPAENIPVDALRGKTQEEADAMVVEKRNRDAEVNPAQLGQTAHEQSAERHAEQKADRDAQHGRDTRKP